MPILKRSLILLMAKMITPLLSFPIILPTERAINMNMIRIVITILFLVTLLLSHAHGNSESAFRESKIGGFDFSEKLMTNSQLIKKYGPGCRNSNDPDHYNRY